MDEEYRRYGANLLISLVVKMEEHFQCKIDLNVRTTKDASFKICKFLEFCEGQVGPSSIIFSPHSCSRGVFILEGAKRLYFKRKEERKK